MSLLGAVTIWVSASGYAKHVWQVGFGGGPHQNKTTHADLDDRRLAPDELQDGVGGVRMQDAGWWFHGEWPCG
jgi:hypothetical protein